MVPAVCYSHSGEEMIPPLPEVRAKGGALKAHHYDITLWIESPITAVPGFIRILARER